MQWAAEGAGLGLLQVPRPGQQVFGLACRVTRAALCSRLPRCYSRVHRPVTGGRLLVARAPKRNQELDIHARVNHHDHHASEMSTTAILHEGATEQNFPRGSDVGMLP